MSVIPTSEIASLSLLYKLRKLASAPPNPDTAANSTRPSRSFNDRIGLVHGDITKLGVDAIVNAANNSLLGGGGVDGAIHRAAGPQLKAECRKLRGCETGSAKITDAYDLPCKKVIHAVGPIYDSDNKEECEQQLSRCYKTSLELAVSEKCKSIAFSALSTGVYGYPSDHAAPVAIKTVKEFLESRDGDKLEKVVFCTFVQKDAEAYDRWLPHFFPSSEIEAEEAWEQVEGGESAENGLENGPGGGQSKVELPEVPKGELVGEGPAAKKRKSAKEEDD